MHPAIDNPGPSNKFCALASLALSQSPQATGTPVFLTLWHSTEQRMKAADGAVHLHLGRRVPHKNSSAYRGFNISLKLHKDRSREQARQPCPEQTSTPKTSHDLGHNACLSATGVRSGNGTD